MENCRVKKCKNPIAGYGVDKCEKHLKAPLPTKTASRPYADYDYLHRLSIADRAWLMKFTQEYYQNNPAKLITLHPKKKHKTLNDENNSRRRCVPLQLCSKIIPDVQLASKSPEDAYIDYLDYLKSKS